MDALKILTLPSVDTDLIKCEYYIKVHLSYISGSMKVDLKAPIKVCRPIIGVPVATLPPPMQHTRGEMMMATPEKISETISFVAKP